MADEKIYTLNDFTITKLYKADSKPGGRKWVRFDLYIDDPKAEDRKFSWFPSVKTPEIWPIEGSFVREMEFVIKDTGEYRNYEVKKILYGESKKEEASFPAPEKEQPGTRPSARYPIESIGKEPSVCTSYVMELAKAMIAMGFNGSQIDESLPMICDSVSRNGFVMYLDLKNRVAKERELQEKEK